MKLSLDVVVFWHITHNIVWHIQGSHLVWYRFSHWLLCLLLRNFLDTTSRITMLASHILTFLCTFEAMPRFGTGLLHLFTIPRCSSPCCCERLKTGETIRQAAERTAQRVLVRTCTTVGENADTTQLHFVGNCPAGWFWRAADEEQLQKKPTHYGEKVRSVRAVRKSSIVTSSHSHGSYLGFLLHCGHVCGQACCVFAALFVNFQN